MDTGEAISLLSEAVYKDKLHHLTLQPTKMKTYTGEIVPVRGSVIVTVELNKQKVKLTTLHCERQPSSIARTHMAGNDQTKLAGNSHGCKRGPKPTRDIEETHADVFNLFGIGGSIFTFG